MNNDNFQNAPKTTLDSRSEEVADIIERMPTGWTRIVTVIFTSIVAVMVTLGCIIEYPDTVMGQISITGEKAPVRMISAASGRLHLLADNNSEVAAGTCIGYIETGANYADILRLDSICHTEISTDMTMLLPSDLQIGALGAYYNDFQLSYIQYDQLRRTKVYDNMRRSLINQQQSDKRVQENLQKELAINEKVLSYAREQYAADSLLYNSGALSGETLKQQYSGVLAQMQNNIELRSSDLVKQSAISATDIELAKIDVNVREELATSFNTMVAKYNILVNQLRQWKELYLFVAPISGKVQYLSFWRENMHVDATAEVFSVSPSHNRMIGELLIPSTGTGNVEVGQGVNVKLLDYPYDKYGYIRGEVEHLSSLACNMRSEAGQVKAYLVTVNFPNGLKTNFGQQLDVNFEAAGTGEIITEPRRLIQRLFDNLKARQTK